MLLQSANFKVIFFYRAINFSRLPFAFLVSDDALSGDPKEGTNRNDLFKAFPRNWNLALRRAHAKKGLMMENVLSKEGTKRDRIEKERKKICSDIKIFFKSSYTCAIKWIIKLRQIVVTV